MQLLGHDYVKDRALDHHGLAGLATLIEDARAEVQSDDTACVLFDNGDFLQGSALGDTLAQLEVTSDHPVLRCFEEMSYDAWGVGNHDLDHGLRYPLELAAKGSTPIISSNLKPLQTAQLRSGLILECAFPGTSDRAQVTLKLGVVSIMPDQTSIWNRNVLCGKAKVEPALRSLTNEIAELRVKGADLVILLAHLGIDELPSGATSPDDARSLAAVAGVDLVVAGHTHRRLPGQDHTGFANVDVVKGTVSDRPAVMPGFNASDLAVLDLGVTRDDNGQWRITDHRTELRPNTQEVKPHPKVSAIYRAAHEATRRDLAQPIGHSPQTLHNFFSLVMPTATCALVARAKMDAVAKNLEGHPDADLPVLATAAAHTAGGRGGPDNYLCIPRGPVLKRHLAGLDPYANRICALRINGTELREWLEYTVGIFHQLTPNNPDQLLVQPTRPLFDFDTIFGLDYAIDPSRPEGARLVYLKHADQPVRPNQEFILATNQFRANGGGGGPRFGEIPVILNCDVSLNTALVHTLTHADDTTWDMRPPWHFHCVQPYQAVIRTSPEALQHIEALQDLQGEYLSTDATGFARIRITL